MNKMSKAHTLSVGDSIYTAGGFSTITLITPTKRGLRITTVDRRVTVRTPHSLMLVKDSQN